MAASLDNMSPTQKDEVMKEVKQQIAVANAQELISKMTEKCFTKCVYTPGTSLDSAEQKCIAMCMDRFMDSWNVISRTFTIRMQRERDSI